MKQKNTISFLFEDEKGKRKNVRHATILRKDQGIGYVVRYRGGKRTYVLLREVITPLHTVEVKNTNRADGEGTHTPLASPTPLCEVYFMADWGEYEETGLTDEEAEQVFNAYMGGYFA